MKDMHRWRLRSFWIGSQGKRRCRRSCFARMDSPFCFFFGCGSTKDDDRCFDRTGTGVVMRVVAVGKVIVVAGPGIGSGPGSVMRPAGRDGPVERIDV